MDITNMHLNMKHECVYCGKEYPGKLPSHFEAVHKNELAVQRALAYMIKEP